MATLTRAHQELFRRTPDETFPSLSELAAHCRAQQENSEDRWHRPQELLPTSDMTLCAGGDGAELRLNDWSFSQLCRLCGVSKDTLNRLSTKTASRALQETLPQADKPLQILTTDDAVRSIHGVSYTRLWNAELVATLQEFAVDFRPPQERPGAAAGSTAEAGPVLLPDRPDQLGRDRRRSLRSGFFVWNSEVGRRSLGIQTFWFRRSAGITSSGTPWRWSSSPASTRRTSMTDCGNPADRRAACRRRDARRDGFADVIAKAMRQKLGQDAEEAARCSPAKASRGTWPRRRWNWRGSRGRSRSSRSWMRSRGSRRTSASPVTAPSWT